MIRLEFVTVMSLSEKTQNNFHVLLINVFECNWYFIALNRLFSFIDASIVKSLQPKLWIGK